MATFTTIDVDNDPLGYRSPICPKCGSTRAFRYGFNPLRIRILWVCENKNCKHKWFARPGDASIFRAFVVTRHSIRTDTCEHVSVWDVFTDKGECERMLNSLAVYDESTERWNPKPGRGGGWYEVTVKHPRGKLKISGPKFTGEYANRPFRNVGEPDF